MVVEKAQLVVVKAPLVLEKTIGCGKAQLVGGKAPGCVKSTIGCGKSTIGWGKAQFVNPGQIAIFGPVPAQCPCSVWPEPQAMEEYSRTYCRDCFLVSPQYFV